jgi:mannose-6-phosphate isomerase-like protein (cupin superfamily)
MESACGFDTKRGQFKVKRDRKMTHKNQYLDQSVYITKDGCAIRELMHPDVHRRLGVKRQSLAEATVAPGRRTRLHRHRNSEELYYIAQGEGLMTLGADQFPVMHGDTVCVLPGTPHCIENTGDAELKILCCCAPAYAHEDTELL